MSVADALAELATWAEPAAGGWRFLFSPKFRARTREGWRHESIGYVLWDVFWGVLGVVFSIAAAVFLGLLVWQIAVA